MQQRMHSGMAGEQKCLLGKSWRQWILLFSTSISSSFLPFKRNISILAVDLKHKRDLWSYIHLQDRKNALCFVNFILKGHFIKYLKVPHVTFVYIMPAHRHLLACSTSCVHFDFALCFQAQDKHKHSVHNNTHNITLMCMYIHICFH